MKLRLLRKQLGWTQAKLATRVGVRSNTVARWENGIDSSIPVLVIKYLELYAKYSRRTP